MKAALDLLCLAIGAWGLIAAVWNFFILQRWMLASANLVVAVICFSVVG